MASKVATENEDIFKIVILVQIFNAIHNQGRKIHFHKPKIQHGHFGKMTGEKHQRKISSKLPNFGKFLIVMAYLCTLLNNQPTKLDGYIQYDLEVKKINELCIVTIVRQAVVIIYEPFYLWDYIDQRGYGLHTGISFPGVLGNSPGVFDTNIRMEVLMNI